MLHPFWHLPHQQGWNGVGQQGSQDEKSQVQVQPPQLTLQKSLICQEQRPMLRHTWVLSRLRVSYQAPALLLGAPTSSSSAVFRHS